MQQTPVQQQYQGQQSQAAAIPPVGIPAMMPATPGSMNMATPGTVLPNGQFVPNAAPAQMSVLPDGQVMAPPAGGGMTAAAAGFPVHTQPPGVEPNLGPVITREQQQVVGVPPGMTRESMAPGYDPRLKKQRRVFDPRYSFKDSFGNSRNRSCCTIS
ncbi:unnamed protein product [Ectocarpus sp. 12 AP-2014]